MAKKRTGTLVRRKSGYRAKFWALVDGEWIRVTRDLHTDNETVAQRKLARLIESENVAGEDLERAEAVQRIVDILTRWCDAGPGRSFRVERTAEGWTARLEK